MNPTITQDGFVYLIHAVGTNRIKIGYTATIKSRLSSLQTASPFQLELIDYWPGSLATEQAYHTALSEYRRKGEWFEMPDVILAQFLEKNGQVQAKAHKVTVSQEVAISENRDCEVIAMARIALAHISMIQKKPNGRFTARRIFWLRRWLPILRDSQKIDNQIILKIESFLAPLSTQG